MDSDELYKQYVHLSYTSDKKKSTDALFDYYDSIKKNEHHVDTNKPLLHVDKIIRRKHNIPKNVSILNNFNIKRVNHVKPDDETISKIENKVQVKTLKGSRAGRKPRPCPKIVLNEEISKYTPDDYCPKCKHGDNVIRDNKHGTLVCECCGDVLVTNNITENDEEFQKYSDDKQYTYMKEYDPNNSNVYEREGHFSNHALRDQALEPLHVEDEFMFDKLRDHIIKKHGVIDNHIHDHDIRSALKDLGYNEYYQHIPKIREILLGERPIKYTEEQITNLLNDQSQLCETWEKIKPRHRSNLFSYRVQMYFLKRKNGIQCSRSAISHLLKDPYKTNEIYRLWREICDANNWKYEHFTM